MAALIRRQPPAAPDRNSQRRSGERPHASPSGADRPRLSLERRLVLWDPGSGGVLDRLVPTRRSLLEDLMHHRSKMFLSAVPLVVALATAPAALAGVDNCDDGGCEPTTVTVVTPPPPPVTVTEPAPPPVTVEAPAPPPVTVEAPAPPAAPAPSTSKGESGSGTSHTNNSSAPKHTTVKHTVKAKPVVHSVVAKPVAQVKPVAEVKPVEAAIVPQGGVQAGAGGTADVGGASSTLPLGLAGGSLLLLLGGGGMLAANRRRGS
jgi:hypothetical protein